MQFLRNDLDKLTSSRIDIDEPIDIEVTKLVNRNRLIALRDVFVGGHIYYDKYTSHLITDLRIEGIMTVPCAITLNPFDIEFSAKLGEMFSFDEVEDELADTVELIDGETLDLTPYLEEVVNAAVPLKAIDPELASYPKGEGWEVLTEEDYIKEKSQEIDPRLAKLKDFKFE